MDSRGLKIHYEPDGSWQLTHSSYCGSRSREGIHTTNRLQYVNCKHCLKKFKRLNPNASIPG